MTNDLRKRLLCLLELFTRHTDEEHPLNAEELLTRLRTDYDIEAERKSVYRDIEALQDQGFDIIHTRIPKNGYFLGERTLQLAEVRLLVDAVLSAEFITPKKSTELVKKLQTVCSEHQAKVLARQVYIDHRNKQQNEEIYYTIDRLNEAIERGKKITLQYVRRALGEKGGVTAARRSFTVSPYGLLWMDDRYYLIGNNEKYDDLMHLRVDRMRQVTVLDQPVRSFEEVSDYRGHFDVADYGKKLSNAYSGPRTVIELVCEDAMLEPILDRFGDSVTVRRRPDHRFSFRVEVALSDGLVRDILNLGAGVEVISPKSLREQMRKTIEALSRNYADD